jgi:putative transposase
MTYTLVEELQKKAITVIQACWVLKVSRSGYDSYRQCAQATPAVCATSVKLQAAFAASGCAYGTRRLSAVLQDDGMTIGRYQVRSLMKKHQLRPVWKRKFVNTTDSKHDFGRETMPITQRQ